jgi:FkbH-like protein
VGEAGVDAVSWDLEHHAQAYGLYQQMLDHLADCGVLLGVCSKNELAVVESALRRKDLFLDAETFFPVCAGWGPKSGSVAEILRVWNIDENSVVFIDDNPMELSEVQQVFPGLTCLPFPANDANKIWDLLGQLRDLFGKPFATEEDRLRRASLRATAWIGDSESQSSSPEFIRGLQGVVTLDYKKDAANHRALELLNKTNQFNLNGLRMNEGEWRAYMERPETILSVVSYQDKFGPLGRIGVVLGFRQDKVLKITHWAMSCRAFSRRLEYHTLDSLFRESNAEEIEFAFQPTERNQPLQDFFRNLGIRQDGACTYKLTQSQFLSRAEELPHKSEILR